MSDNHLVHYRWYYLNFTALMILMILTVVASRYDLGHWNLPIALAIAITKATLIVLIFMDVRNGTHLVWIFAGAGFAWFLIMLLVTMTDMNATVHDMGSPTTVGIPRM